MGFDLAQHHALLTVHAYCTDQLRRMENDQGGGQEAADGAIYADLTAQVLV